VPMRVQTPQKRGGAVIRRWRHSSDAFVLGERLPSAVGVTLAPCRGIRAGGTRRSAPKEDLP
jgi:hypothetical protein